MYKLTLKSKSSCFYHDSTMLGHYLAGVWEGDGHTKKNKSSGKTTVHITMHKQQKVYAEKLLGLLSRKSKDILRNYFDVNLLLTSKFLDYKDWCAVDNLLKKKENRKYLKQIQTLKGKIPIITESMFTWHHLDCFSAF